MTSLVLGDTSPREPVPAVVVMLDQGVKGKFWEGDPCKTRRIIRVNQDFRDLLQDMKIWNFCSQFSSGGFENNCCCIESDHRLVGYVSNGEHDLSSVEASKTLFESVGKIQSSIKFKEPH